MSAWIGSPSGDRARAAPVAVAVITRTRAHLRSALRTTTRFFSVMRPDDSNSSRRGPARGFRLAQGLPVTGGAYSPNLCLTDELARDEMRPWPSRRPLGERRHAAGAV